ERTGQERRDWLYGDALWREIPVEAPLFRVWLRGRSHPVPWTPAHVWVCTVPPDVPPWKTVNLRDYAAPQSFLLYFWKTPLERSNLLIFRICWVSLVLGPLLLVWIILRTIKGTPAQTVAHAMTLKKK